MLNLNAVETINIKINKISLVNLITKKEAKLQIKINKKRKILAKCKICSNEQQEKMDELKKKYKELEKLPTIKEQILNGESIIDGHAQLYDNLRNELYNATCFQNLNVCKKHEKSRLKILYLKRLIENIQVLSNKIKVNVK